MFTNQEVRSEFARCFGVDMGLTDAQISDAILQGGTWRRILSLLHHVAWGRHPEESDWLQQPLDGHSEDMYEIPTSTVTPRKRMFEKYLDPSFKVDVSILTDSQRKLRGRVRNLCEGWPNSSIEFAYLQENGRAPNSNRAIYFREVLHEIALDIWKDS